MSDTVVACLTPSGSAAIATLAVHGPEAWNVCRALFVPRSGELPARPEDAPPGRFYLGMLGEGVRDEVILAPRRTTPTPCIELHCHGGREVLNMLLDLFRARGVRVLSWKEWLGRTEPSAIRAEAARCLALAPTVRTAAILLDQYHGALESSLAAIEGGEGGRAEDALSELLRCANLGLHLTKPWRVVVAGAPNAGKSSLVNALAGYQRCIVSDVPGTTRDLVTACIALDGWPVELIDTAGLREAAAALEQEGVDLARREAESADLCLWIVDGSAPPLLPRPLPVPVLTVVNKTDLPPAWDAEYLDAVWVSARTGQGLEELAAAIVRNLVPNAPPPGAAVPFNEELCQRLEALRRQE